MTLLLALSVLLSLAGSAVGAASTHPTDSAVRRSSTVTLGTVPLGTPAVEYLFWLGRGDQCSVVCTKVTGEGTPTVTLFRKSDNAVLAGPSQEITVVVHDIGLFGVRVTAESTPSGPIDFRLDRSLIGGTFAKVTATPIRPAFGLSTRLVASVYDGADNPIAADVRLQRSDDASTWTDVPTTLVDGEQTLYFTPAGRMYFRALFDGVPGELFPSVSAAVPIAGQARFATPKYAHSLASGKRFTFSGSVEPALPTGAHQVTIECYKLLKDKWVWKKRVGATVTSAKGARSAYSAKLALPSGGQWELRAVVPDGPRVARTVSAAARVSVNPAKFSVSTNHSTVDYTHGAKIAAVLRTGRGVLLRHTEVTVYESSDGKSWSDAGTLKTSSKGRVTKDVHPRSHSMYYRFRYEGGASIGACTSTKLQIKAKVIYWHGSGDSSHTRHMSKGTATLVITCVGDGEFAWGPSPDPLGPPPAPSPILRFPGPLWGDGTGRLETKIRFKHSGKYWFSVLSHEPWSVSIY